MQLIIIIAKNGPFFHDISPLLLLVEGVYSGTVQITFHGYKPEIRQ